MQYRHTREQSVLVDTGSGIPVAVVPGPLLVPEEQSARASRVLAEAGSRASRRRSLTGRTSGFVEFELPPDDDGAQSAPAGLADAAAGRQARHGVATVAEVMRLRRAGVEAQPEHIYVGHSLTGFPMKGFPMKGFPMKGFPMKGFPMKGFGGVNVDGVVSGGFVLLDRSGSGAPRPGTAWPGSEVETSLAQPADDPGGPRPAFDEAAPVTVLVLDTGVPEATHRPDSLAGLTPHASDDPDTPDHDSDGLLDLQAGHGAFIAGIIGRLAPGTRVIVRRVLSPDGVARETEVAEVLREYAGTVDLVNLSMGTYTPFHPRVLEDAVRAVQTGASQTGSGRPGVVVASAGNDGVPVPTFPASLPGVVSVGALDAEGPAAFSNYGPWVRACAPGTEVVSTFFDSVTSGIGDEALHFDGWARWSGTSFSAPTVVAALARAMTLESISAPQAVERVVEAPGLLRLDGLGTVVNIA